LLHIFLSCRKSKEATLCFVIFLDNLQAFWILLHSTYMSAV
jgi:hypothetical protein